MRLAAMGYTQVYWYRGGMESWKAARLPVVETPITAQLW
jgi:rhodanese-related sulfurtransferase